MTTLDVNTDGHLHQNIIYFARALRRAGMRIGTAQVRDAVRAVAAVGFSRKSDFYITLRATFVTRAEDLPIFAQTFQIFWRDPEFIQTMMQALMPMLESMEAPPKPQSAERRAQEALIADMGRTQAPPRMREEVEVDSKFSFSDLEKLGSQDFEQMSAQELTAAENAVRSFRLPVQKITARRQRPSPRGTLDPRATFRAARRHGGEVLALPKRAPQEKAPRLVLLIDISGSMSSYSRMMLLFAHALKSARRRGFSEIHVFTFGTRLTNITRKLEARDPDRALTDVGQLVQDWDGGTAIGENLDRFVKDWSRRVLGSDSMVVLVSDGLERGDTTRLSQAAQRLQLSCRQFIWMNPLLRYDKFEPTAGGIAALLPHVDRFIAAHNLNSFKDLAECLSGKQQQAA
ncbi:MAG: VWA domain-containing protein [Pseudomonadota bacterium]